VVALPIVGLLFALRAIALGIWLKQPLSSALGVAAAVPYLLAILILTAGPVFLPRRFELKLAALLGLLLVSGLAWAVGQGFGALAHGPGRRDELELPLLLLVAGHVGLTFWLASLIKSNWFAHPQLIARTRWTLLALVVAGVVAVAVSWLR
jgi:hypothetical protein